MADMDARKVTINRAAPTALLTQAAMVPLLTAGFDETPLA
jgi:hypothetical protein